MSARRSVKTVRLGEGRCGDVPLRLGAAVLLAGTRDRAEDGVVPLDALGALLLEGSADEVVLAPRWRSVPRREAARIAALGPP